MVMKARPETVVEYVPTLNSERQNITKEMAVYKFVTSGMTLADMIPEEGGRPISVVVRCVMCVNAVQGCAKEMFPCLKIPTPVLPGNLASPCTANQPILESLSSILIHSFIHLFIYCLRNQVISYNALHFVIPRDSIQGQTKPR